MLMSKVLTVVLITGAYLLSGCAHSRTKYHPLDESGGYSEAPVNDRVLKTRFAGNAYTGSRDALLLSQFRAIEICKDKGFVTANILWSEDLSTAKTVQRTSNNTYLAPMQYQGSANCYGGSCNGTGTLTGGGESSNSSTWNETYHYPTFDTYFACANEIYKAKVTITALTADAVKPYVKDLMGALQIHDMPENSPNRGILQVGDIVVKVDGNRTESKDQFSSAIALAKNKDSIPIQLIRDGEPQTVIAKAVDNTSDSVQAVNSFLSQMCKDELAERSICTNVTRVPASK
jgi:hypothetical protein